MIVDTSIRGLKLLALSSFLKSNYNAAMSEAIQAIEEMVFNSAAARTVYWAIFDDLVATGELFRQKLVRMLFIIPNTVNSILSLYWQDSLFNLVVDYETDISRIRTILSRRLLMLR